jgi:hypothetical protein
MAQSGGGMLKGAHNSLTTCSHMLAHINTAGVLYHLTRKSMLLIMFFGRVLESFIGVIGQIVQRLSLPDESVSGHLQSGNRCDIPRATAACQLDIWEGIALFRISGPISSAV